MREIKFRAWDKTSGLGKMVTWDELKVSKCEHVFWPCEHPNFEVYLMQFTGLHDKNGREIYEGDVLRREGHKYKHTVKWFNDSCGFNLAWVYDSLKAGLTIEIIGNIYENPELPRG